MVEFDLSPQCSGVAGPSTAILVASFQDWPCQLTVKLALRAFHKEVMSRLLYPNTLDRIERLTHIATGPAVVPSACDGIERLSATHAHRNQLVSHPLGSPLAQLLRLALLREQKVGLKQPLSWPLWQ